MVTQRTGSNSSSDADKVVRDFNRVIEDFYKLSAVDQKRVSKKLKPNHYFTVERKGGYVVVVVIKQNTSLPVALVEDSPILPDGRKATIEQWPFPEDEVWQLKVLVGVAPVDEAIQQNNGLLTGNLIIKLISQLSIPYYISEDKRCLTVGTNELIERDFGPVKPITPLEALQYFGLAGLEEAIERGSVCL